MAEKRGKRKALRDARKGAADRGRIEARVAGNEYAELEQARRGMRPEARRTMILGIVCAVIVVLAMILPTYMFQHSMTAFTLSVFIDNVSSNLNGLVGVFTGNGASFEDRFMLVVCCAVSGAALGMCGSAYQGAFNNPLAAPKTLGVMAGGALGALIYVVFLSDVGPQIPFEGNYTDAQLNGWLAGLSLPQRLWFEYGKAICSMVGCFVVVGIVVAFTSIMGRGKLTNVVVIIFGQVIAASVTALISFARNYYASYGGIDMVDTLKAIENYTMVYDYDFEDLGIIVLPLVICMVIVLAMRRRLTLLSFGDDEAATMGINVNRTRYAMIAVCTAMTAIAISFCGHVAFLGFISAQLARRLVGPDFRYLLPASLFTGAGLLSVIQWICQSGLPYTDPYAAGTVCSIVGACLFIVVVLAQYGKEGSGEWR